MFINNAANKENIVKQSISTKCSSIMTIIFESQRFFLFIQIILQKKLL